MSSERVTRIVRSWLEDGVDVLPDRVLDSVLDRLPTTPQRRHWWQAWRDPSVNALLRIALAGAAVLVVAVVAISYLNQPRPAIGPAVPTPTASPAPTDSPAPTVSAEPLAGQASLEPGKTYFVMLPAVAGVGVDIFFSPPPGYAAAGSGAIYKPDPRAASSPEGRLVLSALGFDYPTQVYSDPCLWISNVVDVGPTVDDLVTVLAAQPGRNATAPVDVTVDGFAGKRLQLTVPADIPFESVGGEGNFPDCNLGEFRSWPGRHHGGPGQIDDLWILDVDGYRLVLDAFYWPDTPAADVTELEAIIAALDIRTR